MMGSWGLETMIFAGMAVGGVALLVILFLLSEVFGVGDHDVDADVEIDVDHDGGHGEGSLVNFRIVVAFITGLGATGWVLSGFLGIPPVFSVLLGLVGGAALAIPLGMIYRWLQAQASTSSFKLEDLVDQQAKVVLAIPVNGVGRVQYEWQGSVHTSLARSKGGAEIPQGSTVRIKQVVGGEMQVSTEE